MGIFDLFTGKAAKKASAAQIAGLRAAQDAATGAIDTGVSQGTGYLLGPGTDALRQGTNDALVALQEMYPIALDYGRMSADAFNPMISTGRSGVDAYADATGAHGLAGQERARANFRSDPGYTFQMEQGLDALNRSAAARGMLGSGNTSTDVLKFSQGLADQSFGNYVSRLQPLMNMYQSGLQGQASAYGNQAGIASNFGAQRANLHSGLGQNLSGVFGNVGSMYNNAGSNKANILSNIGSQIAQTQGQGIMGAAQGQAAGLNAGLGLVGKLFGMFG